MTNMQSSATIIKFPLPRWMIQQQEWAEEYEAAISYYANNPARRSSCHYDWWENILYTNQEHFNRYPKSFWVKVAKRYGNDKTAFWVHYVGEQAVIEIFSFHEFMEHIRG